MLSLGTPSMTDHVAQFFTAIGRIAAEIDIAAVDRLAHELAGLRKRQGRLFLLGVGGGAGNCSHAVNDFRKLCGIEAYSPVDNVSELTARTNDEGWETVFTGWLEVSRVPSHRGGLPISAYTTAQANRSYR
jgi:D-sedoheptulose 7-phosphate isomerase